VAAEIVLLDGGVGSGMKIIPPIRTRFQGFRAARVFPQNFVVALDLAATVLPSKREDR
jgi:hypothetical protein